MLDPVKISLTSSLIMQNLVVIYFTVCVRVGAPKNSGDAGALPIKMGRGRMADLLETHCSPRAMITNFIALGQSI